MEEKSTFLYNKYNEEISSFYNNLFKNHKLFSNFVTFITNLQNDYGNKQSVFDYISGTEKNFLVFNNEIERLNHQVTSAAGSLRRFNQIRESNQINSEWNELSSQIRTLLELLNHFLLNTVNISNNNVATSTRKFSQYSNRSELPKANNFTQTGMHSNIIGRTSKFSDPSIESEIIDYQIANESNFEYNDTPQISGPIRRKKTRHSTNCCSCGKSKVANKYTQTTTDPKKHDKSGCCLCPCKCCKEDSKDPKAENDNVSWVTVYEVYTQTGEASSSQKRLSRNSQGTQYSNKDLNSTSSIISPTPYGVSINSLPVEDQPGHSINSITPIEDNIKLLLKLLEEIEKSLNVVKQLHTTLKKQIGGEPSTKSDSLDEPSSKSINDVPDRQKHITPNDINLHLTVTLENDLPEHVTNLELNQNDQTKDIRKSIKSGRRISNFFKRKNGNSSVRHDSISQTSIDEQPTNEQNNYQQNSTNNHFKGANLHQQGEDNISTRSETSNQLKTHDKHDNATDRLLKSSINQDFDRLLSDYASIENNNSNISRKHNISFSIKLDSNQNVTDIELITGGINNNHGKSEINHDQRRSSINNRISDNKAIPNDNKDRPSLNDNFAEDNLDLEETLRKSIPRNSLKSNKSFSKRTSFRQSLYEDDPNFTKCLLTNGPDCKSGVDKDYTDASKKLYPDEYNDSGRSYKRDSFQQSFNKNNTNFGEQSNFREVNQNKSFLQPSLYENYDQERSPGSNQNQIRKSDGGFRNSSLQQRPEETYQDLGESTLDNNHKTGGNSNINNKRTTFSYSKNENIPTLVAYSSETVGNYNKSRINNNEDNLSGRNSYENNPKFEGYHHNVEGFRRASDSFNNKTINYDLKEHRPNENESYQIPGKSNNYDQKTDSRSNQLFHSDNNHSAPINNSKTISFNQSVSGEDPNNKEVRSKYETTNMQENKQFRCHCCDNERVAQTKNIPPDTFRCPTCQHRCVYCKTCFEIHEPLYSCLKNSRDGNREHVVRNSNTNTTSPRNDKNFWAEAMMYLTPSFISSLKNGTKPENTSNQNITIPSEVKPTEVDQKCTDPSNPSSPECDRKLKYKWVLIRLEHFEDGTRQINLINDTDIPENTYLTASK